MSTNGALQIYSPEALEAFEHLKSMIISNARLLHGNAINGRLRNYDVVTSSRVRSRGEFRVCLIGYEDTQKPGGKVDVESKILGKSGVKFSLGQAMEDLLKKTMEQMWDKM